MRIGLSSTHIIYHTPDIDDTTNTHMDTENPFLTREGIATVFKILYQRLYNSINDPANQIAHVMCTRDLSLCLTKTGMYPFKGEYMYFIPFQKLPHNMIEYTIYCMDNMRHTEHTLMNKEDVIIIESAPTRIDKKDMMLAVCSVVLSQPTMNRTQLSMLSILIQRLQCRLNINNTTMSEVYKFIQEHTDLPTHTATERYRPASDQSPKRQSNRQRAVGRCTNHPCSHRPSP